MRIQPNYISPNYSQTTFRASFSKDPETTAILKEAVKNSSYGGYPLYYTMQSLANMNSKDSLSISRPRKDLIVIKNDRTGYMQSIDHLDKNYFVYGNGIENYDMQMAICDTIGTYRKFLFDDTSLKYEKGPHFNLSANKTKRFIRNTDTGDLYKKIGGIKKEIGKLQGKIDALTDKIDNKEKEYTLSLLG